MDEDVFAAILRRFLAGELSRDEAVRELLPIAEQYSGMASSGIFTPEEHARVDDLAKALSWQLARDKKTGATVIPDVAYGSPEYQAFLASIPRVMESDADDAAVNKTQAELVAWFAENACPDHHVRGGPPHVMALHAAERILARHPEVARDSIYTAVVCGDLDEVKRILTERPQAASEKGGPKGWEPLLYLCFTRLPLEAASDNAVAIARALLDGGADPNAYFMGGDSRYTPLVGVIGEGEEHRPPHPQREALTRLLLERGAEPYDNQVLYNIHFHGNVRWFLELIYAQAVKSGRQADWDDPNWPMLDMGGYGCGARYLLGVAVGKNDIELAEWLLTHGASPNAAPPRDRRFPKRTLHEEALRSGLTEMAELLVRYGATPTMAALEGQDAFAAACLRLDRQEAQALLVDHPEYLLESGPMFVAAERDRADVVALLLYLGMSPDIEDPHQGRQRPLHVAAYNDSPRVAALLIERGAAVDPVDSIHDGTPLWFAVWGQRPRTIALLSRVSRDLWSLTFTGDVERVREVLSAEPELARLVGSETTPLMWLPADEARAMEIVDLLLAHGADPSIKNMEEMTAAECASKRGLDHVAELLRSRAGGR